MADGTRDNILAELLAKRKAREAEAVPAKPAKVKRERPKSRTARWQEAAGNAVAALEELKSIQEEYEEWKDNLPENLEQSALGEKLQTVCDIDIESALDAAQEADGADLPQGFGRD